MRTIWERGIHIKSLESTSATEMCPSCVTGSGTHSSDLCLGQEQPDLGKGVFHSRRHRDFRVQCLWSRRCSKTMLEMLKQINSRAGVFLVLIDQPLRASPALWAVLQQDGRVLGLSSSSRSWDRTREVLTRYRSWLTPSINAWLKPAEMFFLPLQQKSSLMQKVLLLITPL